MSDLLPMTVQIELTRLTRLTEERNALRAELNTLRQRLTEAERDAARYRWLRSQDPLQSYCPMCTYDGLRLIVGEALDRAVDNGMKAQP